MSANRVSSTPSVEPLWDAGQLSRRLGIHRNRLYLLVRTGRIPHLHVGRTLRFNPDAIRAWERSGGWVTPNVAEARASAKRVVKGSALRKGGAQ